MSRRGDGGECSARRGRRADAPGRGPHHGEVNGIAGRKRRGRLTLSWTARAPDQWMIARLMRWVGLAMAPLSVLALPWSLWGLGALALAFVLLVCGHDTEYRQVRVVLDGGWLTVEDGGPARRLRADA